MSEYNYKFGMDPSYFTSENSINIADLEEIVCQVKYNIYPGCEASGPTYNSGGEPAVDSEIEIVEMQIKDANGIWIEIEHNSSYWNIIDMWFSDERYVALYENAED